ncbi:hypothetical protein BDW68DRAFT_179216 [Aspergillus falconensis]
MPVPKQLFLGVLNQLRDAKLKIDNEKLAEFMGPECLPGAVHNRIVRLRRMAEAGCSDGGGANGDGEEGAGSDTASPKRKAVRKPRGAGRSKKAKTNAVVGSEAEANAEADAGVKAKPQAGVAVKREHEHEGEADCAMNECG